MPHCDSCGCRVLELLYCQPCGEVFLGGYKKPDPNSTNAWFLSPDYPNLDQVPDRLASLRRTFGEYLVFWPANGRPLYRRTHAGPQWRWLNNHHRWQPAALQSLVGRLTYEMTSRSARAQESIGFAFNCTDDQTNAFPRKCPHCGEDWSRRRIESPIRDLGSGFQRVMQLLSDGMMRETLDAKRRKLVLFSDSRQDAAKLSTGIKRAHHLDNLRQTVFHRLMQQIRNSEVAYHRSVKLYNHSRELLQLARRQMVQPLNEAERDRHQQLVETLEPEAVGRVMQLAGSSGTLERPSLPTRFGSMSFDALLTYVRQSLLQIGVNPGGTIASRERISVPSFLDGHRRMEIQATQVST